MKTKLLILLVMFALRSIGQVPDTNTFTFWDITNTIYGDHNVGRNLVSCFADADAAKFDPVYGSKAMSPQTMLGFRNYGGGALPTVTTASVTAVMRYSATGGGNVTSAGRNADGSIGTVTERGVCWNTWGSPTIANGKSSDGTGTGNYASSIISLSEVQTYYVRAYATNSLGTAYGSEVSFTTLADPCTKSIGDTYGGGKIFYFLQPGDAGYDANVCHGLIVSSDLGLCSAGWGCYGTIIGTSTLIGTGQTNTNAIISGCSTANIAARMCNDLVENGYDDWYLPSAQEAIRMWNVTYITDTGKTYWSSSEDDGNIANNAVYQLNNYTGSTYKADAYVRVRAIRSF